jgi:hypothetical protein
VLETKRFCVLGIEKRNHVAKFVNEAAEEWLSLQKELKAYVA